MNKFRRFKYLIISVLLILLIGAVSTYIHFLNKTVEYGSVVSINLNLILMTGLITLGLVIRFFKWHFFLRLYNIRIRIRRSLTIFFASLFVNLFFPFLIGEVLTKNYFLKKENYTNQGKNIILIIFERALDFMSIVLIGIVFLLLGARYNFNLPQGILVAVIIFLSVMLMAVLFAFKLKVSLKLIACLMTGIVGWFVIYLTYFTFPAGIASDLSFPDFGWIFSNYLIFYPATPMGIFLSGNYLIITLEKLIHEPQLLLQTVINIRIASIAPSFIFGLAASFSLISKLSFRNPALAGKKAAQQTQFHFDEISDEYTEMIPDHIRERLIERKCKLIIENLTGGNPGPPHKLLGIDLGGGKGWYTSRIIDLTGADVILVERSFNQASDAVKRDSRIKAVVADIRHLPFKQDTADFGFSINVFHHLDNSDAQLEAFESFSRVLKNRHNFFLHEMNVHNLFFKVYMNYLFPLVKTIDEGIECWIDPSKNRFGHFISGKIIYFTFIPDFISKGIMKTLMPVERRLEQSRLRKYSAHYFRIFTNAKDGTGSETL